jgi:hypothetical protein
VRDFAEFRDSVSEFKPAPRAPACSPSTISRPTNQFATAWVELTVRATRARASSKIATTRSTTSAGERALLLIGALGLPFGFALAIVHLDPSALIPGASFP